MTFSFSRYAFAFNRAWTGGATTVLAHPKLEASACSETSLECVETAEACDSSAEDCYPPFTSEEFCSFQSTVIDPMIIGAANEDIAEVYTRGGEEFLVASAQAEQGTMK